jgi:hypothetical protein
MEAVEVGKIRFQTSSIGRRVHDRICMVVGFITTCAISAYHH